MITEDGVEFEDPKNAGSRMLLTPEKSIESQNDIGRLKQYHLGSRSSWK